MPLDVRLMVHQLSEDRLFEVSGLRTELRQAIDYVFHEVEAVKLVEDDHVERRGGSAFLLEAAHVQVFMVGTTVCQPMD